MSSQSKQAEPEQSAGNRRIPATRSFPDEARPVARLEFASIASAEEANDSSGLVEELQAEVARLQRELHERAEAATKQIDEAKLLARLLARAEWEQELTRSLQEDRALVRRTCEEFKRERSRYFVAVEGQVVKLALEIASHVLHREVKMDPMLLTAAVRVALDNVKDESGTRLRVPVTDAQAWAEVFAASGESGVEIVGDAQMAAGECVLETSVGTVEVGIEAQLMEIEQGFFDLLEKRPA